MRYLKCVCIFCVVVETKCKKETTVKFFFVCSFLMDAASIDYETGHSQCYFNLLISKWAWVVLNDKINHTFFVEPKRLNNNFV